MDSVWADDGSYWVEILKGRVDFYKFVKEQSDFGHRLNTREAPKCRWSWWCFTQETFGDLQYSITTRLREPGLLAEVKSRLFPLVLLYSGKNISKIVKVCYNVVFCTILILNEHLEWDSLFFCLFVYLLHLWNICSSKTAQTQNIISQDSVPNKLFLLECTLILSDSTPGEHLTLIVSIHILLFFFLLLVVFS